MACTSRHRHSNYDAITSPAIGGGMHCPSASSSLRYVAVGILDLIPISALSQGGERKRENGKIGKRQSSREERKEGKKRG